MGDLLDRAKKVLFPDAASPLAKEPTKRRARGKTNSSCSLTDTVINNSNTMRDKENRLPKSRGANHTMDSLASTVAPGEQRQRNGGFRGRGGERSSLESMSSSRSVGRRAKKSDSLASIGENSDKQSRENESNTSVIMSSTHESKQGRRRRGRCNHPVSSLVQAGNTDNHNTSFKVEASRKTAVSSLMNLSSSTQKPKSKTSDPSKNELDLIRNIQSMNLNDTKPGHVTSFSSPIVPKHRPFAVSGECTSPPGVLHRLSSLSNNFFSPSKTPGSANPRRKRMDKKKTPDRLTGMEECGVSDSEIKVEEKCEPSPIITEFSISPRSRTRQRRSQQINNPKQHIKEMEEADWNDGASSFYCDGSDEMLISPGVNPRNLVASPTVSTVNPLSGVGDDEFICAKANLFPVGGESTNVSQTPVAKEKIGGSFVIDLELATPRVLKPKVLSSFMEISQANETKTGTIRGSAVLSIQKAPPIPTITAITKQVCNDTSNQQDEVNEKKKFNKKGYNKPHASISQNNNASASSSAPRSERPTPSEEGTRKSARESKPTDRFTVDSWNVNGNRKVRFQHNDASEVYSSDESEDSDSEPLVHLLAGNEVFPNNSSSTRKPSKPLPLPMKKDIGVSHSINDSPEDGQWSSNDVSILRNAQSNIDPTSASYWEEIAALVHGKSASECREKWFSLVATPRGRPPKEIKNHTASISNTDASIDDSCDEEDDLFHSTPMREALLEAQHDTFAKNLHQSSFFGSSFGLSPCIPTSDIMNQAPGTACLNDRRMGYKTYVDKLRKDLNPVQNKAKKSTQRKPQKDCTIAHLSSGNWGKIMADGSVKLTIQEESEEEMDDFFDEEDEE